MDREEFEKRIAALPTVEPDAIDLAMLKDAEAINDGTLVSLEDFKRSLEDYSGRLVLRIPRSLHRDLKRKAAAEGVSLNQYMLYKLAK